MDIIGDHTPAAAGRPKMPSMPKIPRSQNRTPSWRLRMNGSPHLRVTSPGIAEDERFLLTHTGRGDDVSPELRINGLTDDVARLAVVLTDETHPLLGSMTHWLIWNLPAQSVIEAGLPSGRITRDGAVQGRGYGLHRYRGPKPPRETSHRPHRAGLDRGGPDRLTLLLLPQWGSPAERRRSSPTQRDQVRASRAPRSVSRASSASGLPASQDSTEWGSCTL